MRELGKAMVQDVTSADPSLEIEQESWNAIPVT